jgi:signal transduction histidine kinase
MVPILKEDSIINRLRIDIIQGQFDPSLPVFTTNGSFWTGDTKKPLTFMLKPDEQKHYHNHSINQDYRSLALIPLVFGDEKIGLMQLMSKQPDYFTENEIEFYEGIAQILGIAMVNQRAQAALRERVKELTCLYSISQVAERQGISLGEIFQGIVELLPPAWQYSEITSGRIILDGRAYTTSGVQEDGQRQTADIVVNGERRGIIEVIYVEKKPELDEGPFLREERNLINAIARQIALIIEQKEAEKDRSMLQEQLRHADRLATIGQLAAGVAHELNEPLGNILGFAQLAKKCPEIPHQASQDIDKIISASLHGREIIKKLMIFARQMPPKRARIDLNQVVEEGLYFFEARCAKSGIELVRLLSPDIPEITGDQAQLNQVLVNLMVNSIQAMPDGGKLTIQTYAGDEYVSLVVEDTGIGMSEDVIKKIFIPFFTTKDVNEGTGLGLAVVHGIVTLHKGSIKVESKVGQGTRFEIQLPVTGP